LKGPRKFAVASSLVVGLMKATPTTTTPKEEEKKPELVEESEKDMGFNLFE